MTRAFLLGSLLLALSTPALAKPGHFLPESYDLDSDGKITKSEIRTARTTEFTAIDSNSDGYASLAELQTWLTAKQTSDFNSLDSDSSGALSQSEFVADSTDQRLAAATEVFKLADSNGDSTLSADEFKALHPVIHASIHQFVHLDSDRDLQISQTEYLTPPKKPGKPGAGGPPFGLGR